MNTHPAIVLLAALSLAILFTSSCPAQPPDVLWSRTYGGSEGDGSTKLMQTNDRGFILTGHTRSMGAGNYDVWLVKTDESGDMEWNRTYGASYYDWGNYITITDDGGYIITGYTTAVGIGAVCLIKTDDDGNLEWSRAYGNEIDDLGRDVEETPDGGYIVVGRIDNANLDIWLIKTDQFGDTLWTRIYGGQADEWGHRVLVLKDGGYLIVGYTCSRGAGSADVWLIETDSGGRVEWDSTYGGGGWDEAYCVQEAHDGGYIILAKTGSFGAGGDDFWLLKVDSQGRQQWNRTFGGVGNDRAQWMERTNDGGYILVGHTYTFGNGGADGWIIKTDTYGNEQWNMTVGGTQADFCHCVKQVEVNGYIVGGNTYSYGAGNEDFWLIRLGDPVSTEITRDPHQLNFALHPAYPNPFNSMAVISYDLIEPSNVTLDIVDILGKQVALLENAWHDRGTHEVRLNGDVLPSGTYFVRLQVRNLSDHQKIIILK